MNGASALIALLTILAAGFGLGMILLGGAPKISLVALPAIAWLLGTLFISLALTCLGVFFQGLILQWVVALACIALGGTGLRILRRKRQKISWPRPTNPVETLLCAAVLLEFAAVLFMACRESLGWDGLLVWEVKARYAFLHEGRFPLSYFTDDTRLFTHPEYPLMLPMVETWLYLWIGDCDQFWVRSIFPIFYGAGALVIYTGCSQLSGKRWAGLLAASMLFFIPYVLTGLGNALSGYADFPIAVIYLAGVVYFLLYLREGSIPDAILFSTLAGTLPWMKREGVILWLCLMAVAGFQFLRSRNYPAAILASIPGLILWGGWAIAVKILKTPRNTDFLPLTFHALQENINRTGPILRVAARELVNLRDWSLLWIAFAVALPCLAVKGGGRSALQLSLLTTIPLGLYSGIYVLSAWSSYMNHLEFSLPRLILQLSPVALLTVGLAVGAGRNKDIT